MKLCPKCKAELDDNARFCLHCMTSLEEKEEIQPPMNRVRRWPLVLACVLLLGVIVFLICWDQPEPKEATASQPLSQTPSQPVSIPPAATIPELATGNTSLTVSGVTYTFRPAAPEDYPDAIALGNCFVLIRVEGTPEDGIYQIPSFLDDNMVTRVVAIADGAFAGTDAQAIDLGNNVRYVWGNALGNNTLTDLYLHTDVLIAEAALSQLGEDLSIHCPPFLEDTQGNLWSDLASEYGFRWVETAL